MFKKQFLREKNQENKVCRRKSKIRNWKVQGKTYKSVTKSCYLRQEQSDNGFQPNGESDFCNLGPKPTVQVHQTPPTRDSPSSWPHPPGVFLFVEKYTFILFICTSLFAICLRFGSKRTQLLFCSTGQSFGEGRICGNERQGEYLAGKKY